MCSESSVSVPDIEFPSRLVAVGVRGDPACSLVHYMLCDTFMVVMMVRCSVLDNLRLRCRLFPLFCRSQSGLRDINFLEHIRS